MTEFDVITPRNENELLDAIAANQDAPFRFGAGFTDLVPELKKNSNGAKINVINLAKVSGDSFKSIVRHGDDFIIGALATAAEVGANKELSDAFPVLNRAAVSLASRQIRHVATVGGNICTASPAGDILTALVALDAECELLSTNKAIRLIPLKDFLLGVRKIALNKNEVLRSIKLKGNSQYATQKTGDVQHLSDVGHLQDFGHLPDVGHLKNNIRSDFIKIGTRKSMECSVVSLAYHFCIDANGTILQAGIAIGSSAPTVMYAQSACDFIIGKNIDSFTQEEINEFANKVLSYSNPISDSRGSAWYRKRVLYNISKSVLEKEEHF